jgi:hypothetical protein
MRSHFLRRLSFSWITVIIHVQVILSQSTPAPAFLEEPADQEVNPGDNVDLKCKLNQPSTNIMWLKDGQIQNIGSGGVYAPIGDLNSNDHAIRISGVNVDRDDGRWECQALIPDHMGAFGSRKAHLVVRQPPRDRPSLQLKDAPLKNGEELAIRSDFNASVICIARDSNPPAAVKWWVGTKDITDSAETINQTGQNSKLYNTISTLTYQFVPRDNSGQLKCEISHPALVGSLSTYAHLNVLYAPIMTITQDPPGDISEGQDVTLSCFAPANPPAQVKWYQNGQEMTMTNSSSITLQNVAHASNGNYTCLARNDGFEAVRLIYGLNVKYPPTFTFQPLGETADLDQAITLFCDAEGNPSPQIQWLQNTTDGQTVGRGEDRNLSFTIDYSSQGKYWCKARNIINDKENIVLSDVAELLVKGPPKFETVGANPRLEVSGEKGLEATLAAVYCSNPPPTNFYWQREQKQSEKSKAAIPISSNNRKYETSVKELPRSGCYESRLKVLSLDESDSGRYKFWVENEKGPNAITLQLNVKDTSSVPLIVGIVVGLGGALILGLIAIVICYRMKKFCFASNKKSGSFDIEKREVKQENGTVIEATRTMQKEDNLKQNPLQTESMFIKTDKKQNGTANHVNMNGNGLQNGSDLPKKVCIKSHKNGSPHSCTNI